MASDPNSQDPWFGDEARVLGELRSLYRSEIEHEDDILNHRLTWAILLQGTLFVLYAAVYSADGHDKAILVRAAVVMGCISLALSGCFALSIGAATRTHAALRDVGNKVVTRWKAACRDSVFHDLIPKGIVGGGSIARDRCGFIAALLINWLFPLIWLVLLIFLSRL